MLELKTLTPKDSGTFLDAAGATSPTFAVPQRRLMSAALILLLAALGVAVYLERGFWFSNIDQATTATSAAPVAEESSSAKHTAKSKKSSAHRIAAVATNTSAPDSAPAAVRTVLPPLQVEVVASNSRRTIRPGTNAVVVDMERGDISPQVPNTANQASETAAAVTSNASENVRVSADSSDMITRSVTPDYPMLARQMKVQGSVILEALIGRDGQIQDLHILSGPPILANAAEEAVKQWHFKPHFQGAEAVEAQTKITVNFTISTN